MTTPNRLTRGETIVARVIGVQSIDFSPAAAADIKKGRIAFVPSADEFRMDMAQGSKALRPARYGTFIRTPTASATSASTAYAIEWTGQDSVSGFSLSASAASKIITAYGGRFTFDFSAQITSTSSSNHKIWVWPRIDEVDVPDSNTRMSIGGNKDDIVAAWVLQFTMTAGQSFQLMWATSSTDVTVSGIESNGFSPAIPAVILNVARVSD